MSAFTLVRWPVFVFAMTLWGCSNGLPPLVPAATTARLAPAAPAGDLLYVADESTNDVYVYTYPQGALQSTLTGFTVPSGMCTDKAQDVFITEFDGADIKEYAHGASTLKARLKDPKQFPTDCSVDPTTGNLAVTNEQPSSIADNVVTIYRGAKGKPITYADAEISNELTCTYDAKGNLFVDGYNGKNPILTELPHGGKTFAVVTLDKTISRPFQVQWDGSHLAVGDEAKSIVYQFQVTGNTGTAVGSTLLKQSKPLEDFWITGSAIVAPNFSAKIVRFWKYPKGGNPTKMIGGFAAPSDVTVSLAP